MHRCLARVAIAWLDGGPFIVAADDDHASLIGAVITEVNAHVIDRLIEALQKRPDLNRPDALYASTAEAYIAGRDPVMEWILSRPRR
jgi:hypothetical protein